MTVKQTQSSKVAGRYSTKGQPFTPKAEGTRAGVIEDWRVGGSKRPRQKLDRNGYRDGR